MTDDLGSTITIRREADRVVVAVDGCECRLSSEQAIQVSDYLRAASALVTCPRCGRRVPLRNDGTLGLHTATAITPFSDEPQEVGCAGSWTRAGEVAP